MAAKSLSHEEVVARLAVVKPRLQILGRYTNKRTPVELRCLDCLHQWKAALDNKWNRNQGNGCPECAITNRCLTDNERQKSKLRIIERVRIWRKDNPEKYLEQCRQHRIKNREKLREYARRYRTKHAVKTKAYHKQYAKNNRERLRDVKRRFARKWQPMAWVSNPNYRIGELMRTRIKKVLKGERKYAATLNLLDVTLEQLRQHLESQFRDGMTWSNHGSKGWHIDHIIPCSSFDLIDPEQQRKCFHYTNLQPLWWYENLAKGDKLAA